VQVMFSTRFAMPTNGAFLFCSQINRATLAESLDLSAIAGLLVWNLLLCLLMSRQSQTKRQSIHATLRADQFWFVIS